MKKKNKIIETHAIIQKLLILFLRSSAARAEKKHFFTSP